MGLSYRLPIDVATVFLAGREFKDYTLLLVDEFHRFNNMPEEKVKGMLKKTIGDIERLSEVYGFKPEIIICSEFMSTREYENILNDVTKQVENDNFVEQLLETIPDTQVNQNSLVYPLNEIACVEFMRKEKGFDVKLGPSREKMYDFVMRDMGLAIDYAYLIDAYAFGSPCSEPVVHYVGNHNAGGVRVYFNDHNVNSKMKMGPDKASKSILRTASVAGKVLGKDSLTVLDIEKTRGKNLRKTSIRLVRENILEPYKEVIKHD